MLTVQFAPHTIMPEAQHIEMVRGLLGISSVSVKSAELTLLALPVVFFPLAQIP